MNNILTGDQISGIVRTVLMGATGWAVGKGYISNEIAADSIGLGATLAVAAWSWYSNKQTSLIASINNTDNGVKVVADSSPATKVNGPIK
jgi:hypothetical protein